MERRNWIRTGALSVVLGAGLVGVQRCELTIPPSTHFSYSGHERPRVFVSHHPLIPQPDTTLTIRLAPDLPSGVTVVRARATLMTAEGEPLDTDDCSPSGGGRFECQFRLPATEGLRSYRGTLELSNGSSVRSRATYRFTVLNELPVDEIVEVRVPRNSTEGLADTYRVDTAWIRDPEGYALDTFVADVEDSVFNGLLDDPIYRWRDDQLGFFVFTKPGLVTSYFSGFDTRCGKNPWPDQAFPAALATIEVIGLLHRKGTVVGIEGRVTDPTDPNLFRDCAGEAVRRPGVGTFSARTGAPESPLIAKHEFGHAAFGLADEYTETDATRNVPPGVPPGAGACCCREESGSGNGTTPGGSDGPGGVVPIPGPVIGGIGIDTMKCAHPDGTITQGEILVGSPPLCSRNPFPLACFIGLDGGCPSLAGNCVAASAWLGVTRPSDDTSRPNLFRTRDACTSAVESATAHPGVEAPERGLGSCRQLCGSKKTPCPCGDSEFWVADINPRALLAGRAEPPAPDAMAAIIGGELHGGTCAWCVETSLCVRWQRSRGSTAEEAWSVCRAPPKFAVGLERLVSAIVEIFEPIFSRIRF